MSGERSPLRLLIHSCTDSRIEITSSRGLDILRKDLFYFLAADRSGLEEAVLIKGIGGQLHLSTPPIVALIWKGTVLLERHGAFAYCVRILMCPIHYMLECLLQLGLLVQHRRAHCLKAFLSLRHFVEQVFSFGLKVLGTWHIFETTTLVEIDIALMVMLLFRKLRAA